MTDETICPYRPLFSRVIIARETVTKTSGGIIIDTKTAKKNAANKGVVVTVGPTAEGVQAGDEVIFGRYAGTWLSTSGFSVEPEDDEAKFFICNDEDILVVIEKGE